ncbi:MAG: hypothetical protein P8M17_01460 [Saprospiraceae bacterium]|nr:hypothetical protein [Saprospiraceae bacterium]MDG2417629.1 hypothetical protein [Saprospiraceae bacterium]
MHSRYIIIILFLVSCNLQAQDFKDNFFKTLGLQSEFNIFPTFETGSSDIPISQCISISLIGGYYGLRYNLYTLGDNKSLGIEINPSVGVLSVGGYLLDDEIASGLGSFSLPLGISYNLGAGSTYNSAKNRGFAISTGVDFNYSPVLFAKSDQEDIKWGTNGIKGDLKRFYSIPYFSLAFRFFGKRTSLLKQFFVRVSYRTNKHKDSNYQNIPPLGLKIGFGRVIGY